MTETGPSGSAPTPADRRDDHADYLAEVMADIDAEVRRRRAAGDIPPGLERELDELFLEFSPVGLSGTARLRETLALVDGAAFIDTAVPIASEKAVGSQVKRLIRSSISWYMGFIVHQVVKFAWATSRMFHVVADRIEELEAAAEAQHVPDLPDSLAPTVSGTGWWADAAVDALTGVRGRVLHTDCGDGTLLDRLTAAGVDAYGVDPDDRLVEAGTERGLDVRTERGLEHLEVVGGEDLAGLVLTGWVQWLSPSRRDRLVGLAASRLAVGGVLVLHSATPEHWWATESPVVRDLAPGRPLDAATWEYLLTEHGFDAPTVVCGGGTRPGASVAEDGAEYLLVTARTR